MQLLNSTSFIQFEGIFVKSMWLTTGDIGGEGNLQGEYNQLLWMSGIVTFYLAVMFFVRYSPIFPFILFCRNSPSVSTWIVPLFERLGGFWDNNSIISCILFVNFKKLVGKDWLIGAFYIVYMCLCMDVIIFRMLLKYFIWLFFFLWLNFEYIFSV